MKKLSISIVTLLFNLFLSTNSYSNSDVYRQDSGDVPITENNRELLLIMGLVNNQPAHILIDTGANVSEINIKSPIYGTLFRNTNMEDAVVAGGGGTTTLNYMRQPSRITIGTDNITLNGVLGADLSQLESASGQKVDFVVGNDALYRNRIFVNFDERTLRICELCDSSHEGGKSINIHTKAVVNQDVRMVDLTADLEMGKIQSVIVDTGFAGDLTIRNDLYKDMAPIKTGSSAIIAQGINGIVVNQIFVMHDADWKGNSIGDIAVTVDPGSYYIARADVDGVIGVDFLKRFNLEFDFPNEKLWLTPRMSPPPSPPRKTAGILGLPDGKGHLKVMFIMPRSPAEAAGWKSGELLCAINGKAIPDDYAASDFHNWGTDKPGVHTYFTMCDGTKRELIQKYFY